MAIYIVFKDINTTVIITRELKRAYQELVLRFHPDKTGGKECEAFINVQVFVENLVEIFTDKKFRISIGKISSDLY